MLPLIDIPAPGPTITVAPLSITEIVAFPEDWFIAPCTVHGAPMDRQSFPESFPALTDAYNVKVKIATRYNFAISEYPLALEPTADISVADTVGNPRYQK